MVEPQEIPSMHDEWLNVLCSKNVILDLGGGKPYQGLIKPNKLQKGSKYYCMDYCAEYEPNIVGDIQVLPFKDDSVDGIYCGAVLEHVPEPWTAINEMYRILKKDGILLLYVPFVYPYHGAKEYKDYYRFSIDGIQYLFREFSKINVLPSGNYVNATLRFMAAFTRGQRHLTRFDKFLSTFFNKFYDQSKKDNPDHFSGIAKTTTGYNIFAVK